MCALYLDVTLKPSQEVYRMYVIEQATMRMFEGENDMPQSSVSTCISNESSVGALFAVQVIGSRFGRFVVSKRHGVSVCPIAEG